MQLIQRLKGMKDLLPPASGQRQHLEETARRVAGNYGFAEIRTPILEAADLFVRGVGETTDIVEKETYTFRDRGDRQITLRPEGTAGVVRAYLEESIFAKGLPVKLYYLQPAFRSENVQAGRYRQHTQFGVELFGAASALADAEVILLARAFLRAAGLGEATVALNSLGCPECRPAYGRVLQAYYGQRAEVLCEDCRERLGKNPLRLLDCKKCIALKADAPAAADHLCAPCADHFQEVVFHLEENGVSWHRDKNLVRGLDYYTRTVFEIMDDSPDAAAQNTICGGGRYDRLVETLGGQPTPAVGFGLGLERLQEALEKKGVLLPGTPGPQLLVAHLGGTAGAAMRLAESARRAGVRTELELMNRSFKAQFKAADRLGADWVAILGDNEEVRGVVQIKNMGTGEQREISQQNWAEFLASI